MTKEELIRRIDDLEWEDFEVKEAKGELPKNIWETVSAFANTSGGWIVLGVKEVGKKFEICGVDNQDKLEQDFLGTLRSQKFNVRLSASSFRYEIDGKKVIAFYVPSSALKPIYYGSPINTFVRMGSGDQRATEMEVMQMYHDQSFGIRSELAISETSMDMLNMVTFSLRNNIDNVPIDDVSAHLQIDVKAQQEELGEKLGIKCSVIAFLNENLGEKLGIIEEECQKLQCKLGVKYSVKYSVNRFSILCIMNLYPRVTRKELVKILNLSISAIDKNISWLREEGLIERKGADRNGYWQLNLDERENDEY